MDSLRSWFKFTKNNDDDKIFDDTVLIHRKSNGYDLNKIKSHMNSMKNENENVSETELFWLSIFEYVSNGYLVFFCFTFYNTVQFFLNRMV